MTQLTRGEAQARLDERLEAIAELTVTEFTSRSANGQAEAVAVLYAGTVFPILAELSENKIEDIPGAALVLAEAMNTIADVVAALVQLSIGTAAELGGDYLVNSDAPSWSEFVAEQQAWVDSLPIEADEDSETDEAFAEISDAAIEEEVTEV